MVCETFKFRRFWSRIALNCLDSDLEFDFPFCPLYKECILSIKERDAVVQSIFHDLEIIAIFLQTLASSLSWTMESFNLTAVLRRCFLIRLSCSFSAASTKNCNSNINLQSLFYHLILILLPSFSQSIICCDASCGNTSPVTKFLMWWYYLLSNPSWWYFNDDDSPYRERARTK